jgi:hypothetical protein
LFLVEHTQNTFSQIAFMYSTFAQICDGLIFLT